MDLPTLVSRISQLPILGLLSGIFSFLWSICGGPDQTSLFAAADLGLHFLPMSHKKDVSLIWVN